MVRFHNLLRKGQQFIVFLLFCHQYLIVFFTHNRIYQTSIVRSVKIQNEKHENLWFETPTKL
jgi:hypothetical protein